MVNEANSTEFVYLTRSRNQLVPNLQFYNKPLVKTYKDKPIFTQRQGRLHVTKKQPIRFFPKSCLLLKFFAALNFFLRQHYLLVCTLPQKHSKNDSLKR